nr:MAG TPA: hypothetical protein [Caudoviricetes sp.]
MGEAPYLSRSMSRYCKKIQYIVSKRRQGRPSRNYHQEKGVDDLSVGSSLTFYKYYSKKNFLGQGRKVIPLLPDPEEI